MYTFTGTGCYFNLHWLVHDDGKLLFRLCKDISFVSKPLLESKLEVVTGSSYVVIAISRTDFIDKDVIKLTNHFLKHAHLKNIKVEMIKTLNSKVHKLVIEQTLLETA